MANNLRYLLEHFCLDGQKIDVSSQLDEENADNIEKINTQTVPSINARIDEIKDSDIPNINSRIDGIKNTDIPNINQKINTINNSTIPSVQENVNAVNEKADRINESVTKNTRNIGTLSDNVTMQGNAINSINTEKIPSIENKVKIVADETRRIKNVHKHDINGIGESLSTLHDETSNNTSNIGNLTTSINELTTKVDTNTNSINQLNTKVNTNTDSINTINNTSIPHLQSEIDNLSGGGTGSVGELREKVEKNTSDIAELNGKVETNTANISALSGKVDTNTTDISAINGTSIPNLQNQIDTLNGSTQWTSEHFTGLIDGNRIDIYVDYNNSLKIALMHIICNVTETEISATSYISLKSIGYNSVFPKYKLAIPVLGYTSGTATIPAWLDIRPNTNLGLHSAEKIPIDTKLECNFIFQF